MPAQKIASQAEEDLPLRQFLTYRLNRLQARLNAQAARYLMQHSGVTLSEWRVIALIGNQGETTLTEVSREGQLDKGLLSRTLKTLQRRGLVDGRQDDTDHRIQRIRLSRAGATLHAETLPRMRARQRYLKAALSPDELRALNKAIDKLEVAAEATEFDT